MAGRVALVANEKGGVGKSVFTRTLIDWLRVEKHQVAAFDADGTIGATVRILGLKDGKGALIRNQDPAAWGQVLQRQSRRREEYLARLDRVEPQALCA